MMRYVGEMLIKNGKKEKREIKGKELYNQSRTD